MMRATMVQQDPVLPHMYNVQCLGCRETARVAMREGVERWTGAHVCAAEVARQIDREREPKRLIPKEGA